MLKNKYIISLISFFIIWVGVLPFVVTNLAVILCRNFSHNSDYIIELDNPHTSFSILPYARFKADLVQIKSKDLKNSVAAEDVNIKIRILPLLSGKLHFSKFNIDKLNAMFYLKENVELDKDFLTKLDNSGICFDFVKINDFETELYQKDDNFPIKYNGDNLLFQRKHSFVKLKIESRLSVGEKSSKIDFDLFLPKSNDIKNTVFDINVLDLDLSLLKPYFKHYLPVDLQGLQGVVNIRANKNELETELLNCAALMKNNYESIIFPSQMSIRAQYEIGKNLIAVKDMGIDSVNIHVNVDGKISDYLGKTPPALDLNLRVNKSKIEDFISLLPAFKVEEIDVFKLKNYKFYGDVLANVSLKGRLPEPDITGDVYITNGILSKPIPNTTKGATIKLMLTGRYVNFDVFVPAGGEEKVWVKGGQELYNIKYADMVIKSTKSVDLHVAESVVNPLHEILNFIIGPVPILDIYGKGNIDISVKGNRKNPHVWGALNVNNASVNFIEIPDLKLVKADATLLFNNQDATFHTKQGLVNGKKFLIDGVCTLAGKFDFDVESAGQPTSELYKAIQTSTLIPDIKKMLPKIDFIKGTTDIKLKVFGDIKDINDLKFNQNTFARGEILVKDNDVQFQGINATKANGKVKFDTDTAFADITAAVGNSPLSIKAKIKNELGDLVVNIPKLDPNFLISTEKPYLPYVSAFMKYKGNINDVDYDKINMTLDVIEANPKSMLQVENGNIVVTGGNITVKNLKGYISDKCNRFESDLKINSAFTHKRDINGKITLKTPDVSSLNEVLMTELLPQSIRNYTQSYELKKGAVELNCKIFNNKINLTSDLGGVSFIYLPLELPVEVVNGNILLRNEHLKLNKINILVDKMPILIDGDIKDIYHNRNFNLYVNSKPKQDFIDKYINKKQIYPIKIKGDIVYKAFLKGNPDNFEINSDVNMSKDSSIYHFGATLGDIENSIEMVLNARLINRKLLKIKDFSYNKLIDSQSGKLTDLNMLKVNGGLEFLDNDILFKDLKIKTNNPTDARIFNIIFRKPYIKQGQFTSDLKFNGKLSSPNVLGEFHIFETNIPFWDTTMKNIEFVFKDRTIDISSKGEVMGNEITFDGVLKNKLTKPYKVEKAYIYTKNADLNYISEKTKSAQLDSVSNSDNVDQVTIKSIVFDNLKLKADRVELRNLKATNFESLASFDEKGLYDVKKFSFDIANGNLSGQYKYNVNTEDTALRLIAENINANDITKAIFDLDNQIYGDLTGTLQLSCKGANFANCMKTLEGNTSFNVKNGRMPKLGSLEYLLKAGNLVKGGITGVSINSVIDLITPLKTGNFSDIYGNVQIHDGIAQNIEITTQGKDLSLFIGGKYNFATSIADMEVLGILSRKISTMFGPIGNLSINTLFNVIPGVDLSKDSQTLNKINKIPGIELSSKSYRKFIAIIKGNINEDGYVNTFKWIN
jgi:hypothetical protein